MRNLHHGLVATLTLGLGLVLSASACTVTIGPGDTDTITGTETDIGTSDVGTAGTTGGTEVTTGGTSTGGGTTMGPSAGTTEPATSGTTDGTGGTTTNGDDLTGSCESYCENLLGCLEEGEHGFTDQAECVSDCEEFADLVGTDECDGVTVDLNQCVAGLDCQGVSDWWFGGVDPLPCADESVAQIVGCDGPEKCAGYCTVGVECLGEQSADFDNFADCLSICVGAYEAVDPDCQQSFADLNVCIAGLASCDDALSWWNGEGACMAEDEAFLTCGA